MPQITNRDAWGAKPPKGPLTPWKQGQPTGWTIHWAGVPVGPRDHSRCDDDVRQDQAFHQSREYLDVAYSFLVCQHGGVFEGRGFQYESAANGNSANNDQRLAVQYHSGPGGVPLTDEAKQAIRWLITKAGPVGARGIVVPHRAEPGVATACPGDEIVGWIAAGMPVAGGTVPTPTPQPPKPSVYAPWPAKSKPLIKRGGRGEAVRYAQRVLRDKAGQKIAVDGVFGPTTEVAVKNLQKVSKLVADGVVGPKTWAAIDRLARS